MSVTKYWLDSKNRILKTNLMWDNFAEDNDGGERSFSYKILGQNLFSFIAGDSTRMFVETVIQRVRITQKAIEVNYRCDSPDTKRFMKMLVVPEEEDTVRVENSLEKEVPMRIPMRFKTQNQNSFIKRCSTCNKLNHDDDWMEPDELPDHLRENEIPVIYTVCGTCKRNLEQRVRSVKSISQRQIR